MTSNALIFSSLVASALANANYAYVPSTTPDNAGIPLKSFVSFSIELSSFPDFAGNKSHPNKYSDNLLNNIGKIAGTKPIIRVGGNTQDYAVFHEDQKEGLIGIYDPKKSNDYPTTITIGPAFFESYQTWPSTTFTHGFNMGHNSSDDRAALLQSVSYACKALGDNLLAWEFGNEPNDFGFNKVRPIAIYHEQQYVDEWLHWTREIREAVKEVCPDMATDEKYKYYAPSYGLPDVGLDVIETFEDRVDRDKDISHIAIHNYIDGADQPGVTLQKTLMNHTSNLESMAVHIEAAERLAAMPDDLNPDLPYILAEHNSLYHEGRPGLSNTFGAALWGVDFNILAAASNISRSHMHTGTDYRYQSWQPIDTDKTIKGTKAPYYGNIAVAAFLGDLSSEKKIPRVVAIPLEGEQQSAYAAYVEGHLKRLILINLMEYNATDYNSQYINDYPRPVEKYHLTVPGQQHGGKVEMQRLMANGSDAITGCSFDGYSYNYELDNGHPVRLNNVTTGEQLKVGWGGALTVGVPRSSAVILNFPAPKRWGWHW